MTEKTVTDVQNTPKKERFEFALTINGNIVCQRYFRINGFRNRSLSSIELIETIDKCVNMIDNDLKEKTKIFLEMSAPQIFDDKDAMNHWLETKPYKIMPFTFVITRDSEDVFVWDGETFDPYTKYFNRADYIPRADEGDSVLKFAFYDNGVEVASKIWDGNVYPRFIRTNIDLSNSKNKYRNGDVFAPVEIAVIDRFISTFDDLIPSIVREICLCCSNSDDDFYTTNDTYGDTEYNFDIQNVNYKLMRGYEKKFKKKTDDYFSPKK